ncbi:MAG: hypothetical protein HQ523_01675 [Lentisphaerae bacterium]|nr:hypothetical protein [Lentisphaerota bacterium]
MTLRNILITSACAIFCADMACGAVESAPFKYIREITTTSAQEEIAAIPLDESSWELLQADAADLRVFNGADTVVPHLMRRAMAKRLRRVQVVAPSRVTGLREMEGNRIEIEMALDGDALAADQLWLETPLKDFERRVSVDGVGEEGTTVRLVTDALIYDYSRYMDVRHVSVDLPRNDHRLLRVTIDAVTDSAQSPRTEITRTLREDTELQRTETTAETVRPFRINTARLYTHRDEERNRETLSRDYRVKEWSVSEDAKRRISTIEIESYHTPLTALIIETPARNFTRRATVQIPYQRDGREQWRSIGAGVLSRISFRDFSRETMAIELPEQQSHRFRVLLHNGDAPPLRLEGLRGRGPLWQALFLAAPGQSYRLLLGSEQVPAPLFDTAHIERLLARDIAPRPFEIGPLMDNPAYDAEAGRQEWAWLGGRGVFAGVIVVVVVVLGFGLVKAGKRTLEEA